MKVCELITHVYVIATTNFVIIYEMKVSRRPNMDNITPMYDTASKNKSTGWSGVIVLPKLGETSWKIYEQYHNYENLIWSL